MNDDFKKENIELKKQIDCINKENYILKEQYICLEEEFVLLQKEYSENVIIESMNEMKLRYDNMIKTTVPLYKYTLLNEKYTKAIRNFAGCSVLVDHTIKLMKTLDTDILNKKNILLKAELELVTIKDILEDSL